MSPREDESELPEAQRGKAKWGTGEGGKGGSSRFIPDLNLIFDTQDQDFGEVRVPGERSPHLLAKAPGGETLGLGLLQQEGTGTLGLSSTPGSVFQRDESSIPELGGLLKRRRAKEAEGVLGSKGSVNGDGAGLSDGQMSWRGGEAGRQRFLPLDGFSGGRDLHLGQHSLGLAAAPSQDPPTGGSLLGTPAVPGYVQGSLMAEAAGIGDPWSSRPAATATAFPGFPERRSFNVPRERAGTGGERPRGEVLLPPSQGYGSHKPASAPTSPTLSSHSAPLLPGSPLLPPRPRPSLSATRIPPHPLSPLFPVEAAGVTNWSYNSFLSTQTAPSSPLHNPDGAPSRSRSRSRSQASSPAEGTVSRLASWATAVEGGGAREVPAVSGMLLYKCHVCGRQFEKSQALGGHMRAHQGQRGRGPVGARLRSSAQQQPPNSPVYQHSQPAGGLAVTPAPPPSLLLHLPASPSGPSPSPSPHGTASLLTDAQPERSPSLMPFIPAPVSVDWMRDTAPVATMDGEAQVPAQAQAQGGPDTGDVVCKQVGGGGSSGKKAKSLGLSLSVDPGQGRMRQVEAQPRERQVRRMADGEMPVLAREGSGRRGSEMPVLARGDSGRSGSVFLRPEKNVFIMAPHTGLQEQDGRGYGKGG